MATYYLNNAGAVGAWSAGDDANAGTSRTVPKLTWQSVHNLGLVAGTDDIVLYSDGSTAYTIPNSLETLVLNLGEHTIDYNASSNYVINTRDISGGSGGNMLGGVSSSRAGGIIGPTTSAGGM